MSQHDRRDFVRMSLACAAVGVAAQTSAADKPATKRTYLVVYRPGPGWIQGKSMQEQPPLKGHGRYMLELYRKGVLQFAGRFGDNIGGAMAFVANDDAEAAALIEADPAVTTGMFAFELRAWELQPWADIDARSKAR
jgi:uncharacterized protein YciI